MNLENSIASLSNGKDNYIGNASLDKTIKAMYRIATDNQFQIEELAKKLKSYSVLSTSENIFDWVRSNIKYVKDRSGKEELRTPARLIKDAKGDCDCTSILISSILQVLKVPHFFRVVDVSGQGYEHVYVVAISENGEEIILDTVPEIIHFNFEHPHKKRKDFYMETSTSSINGIIGNEALPVINGYLVQMIDALDQFEETEEIKLEKALIKTVQAFKDDEENNRLVIENARDKSELFKPVYAEILNLVKEEGLGEVIATVSAATTLFNVGKNVASSISNLFRSELNFSDPGNFVTGDVLKDSFGNSFEIGPKWRGKEPDYDVFVTSSSGQDMGKGGFFASRLATDGSLYFVASGSNRDQPKGAVLYKIAPNGTIGEGIMRTPEFPADATQFRDFTEFQLSQNQGKQQSTQQQQVPNQQQQVPNQQNIVQNTGSQNRDNTAQRDLPSGELGFFERNKTALIITAVVLGIALTGTTIFLVTKKK